MILLFSSPLGLLKFHKFLNFLIILVFGFFFLKAFWDNLIYASTSNVREVTRVCNLCDQSFETYYSVKADWSKLKSLCLQCHYLKLVVKLYAGLGHVWHCQHNVALSSLLWKLIPFQFSMLPLHVESYHTSTFRQNQ